MSDTYFFVVVTFFTFSDKAEEAADFLNSLRIIHQVGLSLIDLVSDFSLTSPSSSSSSLP